MEYVILDLEWNQSPFGKAASNRQMPFEIIEIGAVKLDEDGIEVDRFSEIIKPKLYKKMHYVTKNLTGITEKELKNGLSFQEVIVDFMLWCGDDYVFCTWGDLDLLELQRNMKYYHLEDLLPGPIRYYDVQKLFGLVYEPDNMSASLEYAVDYLDIPKGPGFHRAINDAEYTAYVFAPIEKEFLEKWYSVDCYQNPKSRKDEISLKYENYSKYVSREFKDKESAMHDREVRTTRCYACGKPSKRKIRWFSGKNRAYFCLAECEEHGLMCGKIRLKRTDEDKVYVIKTLKQAEDEEAERIIHMKEEVRLKRLEKRHKEVSQ